MTYDEIMAGKAGEDVRKVLLTEEQGWLEILRRVEQRNDEDRKFWQGIADEWRKRAELAR